MRRRSRHLPFGAFVSAVVVIALGAAAPVTASSSVHVKRIAPPVRCRVPAVKNKPLAVAVRAILKRHCSLGKIRLAFSKVVKKDHVISEMPRPGTVLPNQGKVNLVISRGRRARGFERRA